MYRSLSTLVTTLLVACTATGSEPSAQAAAGGDSTMVVASEVRVPSDGRPTVVFLGTSITAGLGLDREEDGWVAQVEQMADSAGLPFRAVNAGVSGETSAGGLRRLDWVLRQPLDVLVVELGANDGLRGQDPFAMRSNLTAIIRQTRTRYPDARIVLAGMEAPPNLGPMYTSAFRAVFAEVAEQEQTDFIPFLLDGVAGVPELNQSDRIHPTPEGHRLIARTAWPVLERVLRNLPEKRP